MKKMMKKFKNERGLTLVELLAVVVILAIIAVIAFVLIGKVIDNSKKDAHLSNAQQLIASAKLYEAEGKTLPVNSKELKDAGLLDKLIDPWTKTDYADIDGSAPTNGIVTKDSNNVYSVLLKASGTNCSGTDEAKPEAKIIAKDARDELCK